MLCIHWTQAILGFDSFLSPKISGERIAVGFWCSAFDACCLIIFLYNRWVELFYCYVGRLLRLCDLCFVTSSTSSRMSGCCLGAAERFLGSCVWWRWAYIKISSLLLLNCVQVIMEKLFLTSGIHKDNLQAYLLSIYFSKTKPYRYNKLIFLLLSHTNPFPMTSRRIRINNHW